MNTESNPTETVAQLSLFGGLTAAVSAAPGMPSRTAAVATADTRTGRKAGSKARQQRLVGRRMVDDPNLLAAWRLSKQIRRLREHSPEETQAGLAICRALKAYLDDQTDRAH